MNKQMKMTKLELPPIIFMISCLFSNLKPFYSPFYVYKSLQITYRNRQLAIFVDGRVNLWLPNSYKFVEAEWRIYMYAHINQPSLVQIMTCCLIGTKSLSEPMLEYCCKRYDWANISFHSILAWEWYLLSVITTASKINLLHQA